MTLRQFVAHGKVGTHAQREAFETAVLQGWEAADRHGLPAPIGAEVDEAIWERRFMFWAVLRLGT